MLFDESDSSLNSNDNSFLSNSSDAQSSKKIAKNRNIVNHFYAPDKPKPKQKRAESVKDIIDELTSQKTENSLKLTIRNNSNIKSVHFTSPIAMQSSLTNTQNYKLSNTPKPSVTEANILKPLLAKTKYANTPLSKTDVVRSSSLRYANPSSLKLFFSNQNSTTGKLDESKSLENMKEETASPNTHTLNRLVKMASSWSTKSRASSTSSNYLDPNLVSQLKIKQTHMFLSDENDYATTESCLSRQLAKANFPERANDKWISSMLKRKKKFQPIETSSHRSSLIDDGELILPKMEKKFNGQKMTFVKQRLTRSFRLVNVRPGLSNDKQVMVIKDHGIYKDGQLALPIK